MKLASNGSNHHVQSRAQSAQFACGGLAHNGNRDCTYCIQLLLQYVLSSQHLQDSAVTLSYPGV